MPSPLGLPGGALTAGQVQPRPPPGAPWATRRRLRPILLSCDSAPSLDEAKGQLFPNAWFIRFVL